MFGKCVTALLVLTTFVWANEPAVSARLSFLIWEPPQQKGLLIDGSQVQPKVLRTESLDLVSEGQIIPVSISEFRRSQVFSYEGDGEVRLLRDEIPVAQFSLAVSDEYYVLLKPDGDSYRAFPVALSSLGAGDILISNNTAYPCAIVQNDSERCVVSAGGAEVFASENASQSAHHFQLHCWRGEKWHPEFARHYALPKHSKSLCILYQEERRVRMKFFSGL